MPKKKFSETKVGKFLKKIGSGIFSKVGDILPDDGLFGVLKNLITDSNKLSEQEKIMALKYLEMDIVEMQEVTKRWDSDMKSDSWLSKNTRPLTLIFLTVSMVLLILLDSLEIQFVVNIEWIELLKSLLITVYVAYFGSRGVEKFKSISKD